MAPDLPLSVSRAYLTLTGAVWGCAWVAVAFALFTGRRWAPRTTWVVGASFLIWFWADRLFLVRSEYALRTLPFALFVTVAASTSVLLVLRQTAVRRYFGEPQP